MAFLEIRRHGETHARIELARAAHVIGRDPSLALCLNDLQVSRQHAVLVVDAGGAQLRDLGSRNGSFVNGARLPDRCRQQLRSGDRIQIGESELKLVLPRSRRPRRQPRAAAPAARSHAPGRAWVPATLVACSAALGVALALWA